ncbi:hypothetical protein FIV06_01480 [Labrenzia sp. THAF191b]|uniref:hypothetical protein n=1 Tax=unclassified Labrenzia TaxID=2648686 RepID=UPI0012679ED0|nr:MULTISPECIES: hypothetical protein [unclassified Labrenzia]QFS96070.1 hypothetical protein FIV06_01480 [Labrenzia sp. THAF191b]QFT02385.1 hypothetical protein FIV05_01480 [Labrenzia sp. THAF191a]QFT13927.1 hypothetical protein FIV03_01485 [Labrenzia sp. THAF187b]
MKSPDEWTDLELQTLIGNYRRLEKTDDPVFPDLLEEWSRRKGQGLDFEKTINAVTKFAREGSFLSYKQLADESEADWTKVHYAMNTHLRDLIEFAHRRGWPLLSAIVVNQKNLMTGDMEPQTLKGFVSAAKELGYAVTNEKAFLRDQQKQVFLWAKGQVAADDQSL